MRRSTQSLAGPPGGGRRWLTVLRTRQDGETADVGQRAHAAIIVGDWHILGLLLHPYVHWTDIDGVTIRGRAQVLDTLKHAAYAPAEPRSVELRDGQIYRWRA